MPCGGSWGHPYPCAKVPARSVGGTFKARWWGLCQLVAWGALVLFVGDANGGCICAKGAPPSLSMVLDDLQAAQARNVGALGDRQLLGFIRTSSLGDRAWEWPNAPVGYDLKVQSPKLWRVRIVLPTYKRKCLPLVRVEGGSELLAALPVGRETSGAGSESQMDLPNPTYNLLESL